MVRFYIKSVTISGNIVAVDYEIVLSNEKYEGVIGGGRTELPIVSIENTIDQLRIELENYLESTVGMAAMNKTTKPEQEEDPL